MIRVYMQWLYILLCAYDGFYENYLCNDFYVDCFLLKSQRYFEICKYAFFKYLKNFLRYFKYLKKGYEQKNCARFL